MSGVALTFSFDDAGAGDAFGRLRAATENLRPVLEEIGQAVERSTRIRIGETSVSPAGQPWRPSRRVAEQGGLTLRLSGRLEDSISYRVEPDAVEVGSAVEYAAIHQFGGTITAKGKALRFRLAGGGFVTVKSVKIPARPYLGLSAADREEIPQIVTDAWRAAGGLA